MKKSANTRTSLLVLQAETAAELMTPNPVSINAETMVNQAVAFLVERGFSAAPVIDAGGRPLGVLSQSDILTYDRRRAGYVAAHPEYYHQGDLTMRSGQFVPAGVSVENLERTRVRDIMTAVVFSVAPEASTRQVIEEMLTRKIHRLFVVDRAGVLIGVISALDVLQHLRPEEPQSADAVPENAEGARAGNSC